MAVGTTPNGSSAPGFAAATPASTRRIRPLPHADEWTEASTDQPEIRTTRTSSPFHTNGTGFNVIVACTRG